MCIFKRTSLNEEIWGAQKLLTGLHSWVTRPRTNTTLLLLLRLALAGNNFQPFPPCRPCLQAGCPWVSEGQGRALKLLFCMIGTSFPSPCEILISSKQRLLWFSICSLRSLTAGFYSYSKGVFCTMSCFQGAHCYYFLYRFSATNITSASIML